MTNFNNVNTRCHFSSKCSQMFRIQNTHPKNIVKNDSAFNIIPKIL